MFSQSVEDEKCYWWLLIYDAYAAGCQDAGIPGIFHIPGGNPPLVLAVLVALDVVSMGGFMVRSRHQTYPYVM